MKRLLLVIVFVASPLCSSSALIDTHQDSWVRVAPIGESFSIMMPTGASEGTRRVGIEGTHRVGIGGIGERDWIAVRVYSSVTNNRRYLVFSFAKTAADKFAALSSFDRFVKSIEQAFGSKSHEDVQNEVTSFSAIDAQSDGGSIPQKNYHIQLGKHSGVVALREAATSFHALMVIGADENDPEAKRFLSTFGSGEKNKQDVNVVFHDFDSEQTGPHNNFKAEPPPEPWPVKFPPIFGGVLNGKASVFPGPTYPRGSRDSGMVAVQIVVDELGNIIKATPVEGALSLQAVSVRAALSAKLTPTKLDGQPVKVTGVLVYKFVNQRY